MADKITVLLVDDHALVRKGFRRMLEDDPDDHGRRRSERRQRSGEAGAGAASPSVTVMDCALPGISGIEASRQIRAKWADAAILMLSMHSEDTLIRQALEAGARGYILKNAMDLDLIERGERRGGRKDGSRSAAGEAGSAERRARIRADARANWRFCSTSWPENRTRKSPRIWTEREHGRGASREYHGCARHPQDGGAGGVRDSERPGHFAVRRRDFLSGAARCGIAAGLAALASPFDAFAALRLPRRSGFQLVDVTSQAGIHFQHNSGAYGGKLLPETLGSGCAFLDYDADGWQDILLVNAMDWPGHKRQRIDAAALSTTIATARSPM